LRVFVVELISEAGEYGAIEEGNLYGDAIVLMSVCRELGEFESAE